MSDSGSSSMCESTGSTSARMLERRVSNNRAELTGDGQMNYFFAWFTSWSELQKTDFVSVLAEKINGVKSVNGVSNGLNGLHVAEDNRPPSLFACQVKLFRDWCHGWSDDQKNYLVMRLKDIDAEFHARYEDYVSDPAGKESDKDYFEPGIPEHLVRHKTEGGLTTTPPKPSKVMTGHNDNDNDLKKPLQLDADEGGQPLSTIAEDS